MLLAPDLERPVLDDDLVRAEFEALLVRAEFEALLVRAEFEAIVAAEWPEDPPGPPDPEPVPRCGPRSRPLPPRYVVPTGRPVRLGGEARHRQRSPP